MKTLYLEAKNKSKLNISPEILSVLPKKIGLLYTIQYENQFNHLKVQLEKLKKKIIIGKSSLKKGQILGCNVDSALSIKDKVDCFLLVSSGGFHALSLALSTEKPVYILRSSSLEQIENEEIEQLKRKRKSAVSKFLMADNIGIIVSTKQGQSKISEALEIKKALEKKGKKVFVFISETLNINELENFKIDSWINTACPGIAFDYPSILNLSEYKNIEKFK